jgi:hypothetical protein
MGTWLWPSQALFPRNGTGTEMSDIIVDLEDQIACH